MEKIIVLASIFGFFFGMTIRLITKEIPAEIFLVAIPIPAMLTTIFGLLLIRQMRERHRRKVK